jgi:TRAP-type C4-dicarboxylate transport system permease small subunit
MRANLRKLGRMTWVGMLKLQRVVMLTSICMCLSAMVGEVVARTLNMSLLGVEDLGAYVGFWLYFVGAGYSAYQRNHVKAEFMNAIVHNPQVYTKLRALASGLAFALCSYATLWSYQYLHWAILAHEDAISTLFGRLYPAVYFQASIPFGLTLMTFYFLIEFIQWCRPLVRGIPVPEEIYSARKEID